MKGDYHIHTYYSDGVFSPEKIVDLALEAGLQAISLTDHDNVLSYNVAVDYLKTKEVDLKIIQGIEVNTLYKEYEVHILGYFPDVTKSDFKNLLKIQQQARTKQTKEILALLNKKEGIKIKYDDVKNMVAEGGSIGRPHIAKAITNAGGTSNIMEAYSKYIHRASPVYVERKTVSPFDAVEVIYDSGGIPVIAHPYDIDIAEKLIKELIPGKISLGALQRVLQNLLQERDSIRDLPTIMEGISEAVTTTHSLMLITEHVRTRLARQLSNAYANEFGVIPLVTLSAEWEKAFAEAIVGEGDERQLAMAPSVLQGFITKVRNVLEELAAKGESAVLLTSPGIRPFVRSIIERFRPLTVVMSQNEIHPKAKIKTVGQI